LEDGSGAPVSAMEAGRALVSVAAIRAARERISGLVRLTPIVSASSDEAWAHLRLKCENLQAGGAFKLRGAFNFLSQLDPAVRARGVVTYSSGNHGQAMALAARALGAPAVVVMPTTAPAIKVEGARSYGADVQFAGTTSIHRRTAAEAIAAERGLTIVPPFDHADIIAGQGTVGLEILEQEPAVSTVYVPVGGGGLISGVAASVKQRVPGIRVVGVEPEGAPKMSRSLAAGAPATLDRIDSIADGLLAVRPGELTFQHVQAFVDDVVTVNDDEIREAMRFLARHAKLVVEPSGAASVAGARRLAPAGATGVHVAVVSGGNVEMALLREILGGNEVQ
jgi:threo-3-hydroxy-L-aspartate ammonia-lyase